MAREKFELDEGLQPDKVGCELESIRAMREATASELAEPGHAAHLENGAARDDASMDEIEAAKRANPHWPRPD